MYLFLIQVCAVYVCMHVCMYVFRINYKKSTSNNDNDNAHFVILFLIIVNKGKTGNIYDEYPRTADFQ